MCNHSKSDEACAGAMLVDEQEATIAVMDKLGRAEQLLRHSRAAFRQITDMEGREGMTEAAFVAFVLDRIGPHWLERIDKYFAAKDADARAPAPVVKAA